MRRPLQDFSWIRGKFSRARRVHDRASRRQHGPIGALFGAFLALHTPARAASRDPIGPETSPPPPGAPSHPLPAVPVEKLRSRAPSPQWDTGLWAGVCTDLGARMPASPAFCGGAVADVSFLRARENQRALGAYAGVGTKAFQDARFALGLLTFMPLGDLFGAEVGVGATMRSDSGGVSPGIESKLSFGLRSLNQYGHYGHSHALVAGVEHIPGESSRAGTTLSLALRVDAFWFALPIAWAFRWR